MGGETEREVSGWTVDTLKVLVDERWRADKQLGEERDRRYAEVKNAEEKALKVKEEADRAALGLAREIQTYKDEKANELREQISRERGSYATQAEMRAAIEKMEAVMKPALDAVSRGNGMNQMWGWIVGAASLAALLVGVFIKQ